MDLWLYSALVNTKISSGEYFNLLNRTSNTQRNSSGKCWHCGVCWEKQGEVSFVQTHCQFSSKTQPEKFEMLCFSALIKKRKENMGWYAMCAIRFVCDLITRYDNWKGGIYHWTISYTCLFLLKEPVTSEILQVEINPLFGQESNHFTDLTEQINKRFPLEKSCRSSSVSDGYCHLTLTIGVSSFSDFNYPVSEGSNDWLQANKTTRD